jgi:hypothetical protein
MLNRESDGVVDDKLPPKCFRSLSLSLDTQ